MHIDQNEKLIRFGVTHVAASDGYSGKLVENYLVLCPCLWRIICWFTVNYLGELCLFFVGILYTCMQAYSEPMGPVDCGREFALCSKDAVFLSYKHSKRTLQTDKVNSSGALRTGTNIKNTFIRGTLTLTCCCLLCILICVKLLWWNETLASIL